MKILTVLGTRPEAIKLAPVIRALDRRARAGTLRSVVCGTGQHREMLDQVLRLFELEPDYDLAVMEADQTPCQVAAAVLQRLEPVLEAERPDWLLVQGDTTTVAAAALGAYYHRIQVGHVEAGLRTHDKWRPFPEEVNRRVAGVVADLHFAPTARARDNLLAEGVPATRIAVTGNPVIDALHWVAERPATPDVTRLLADLGLDRADAEQGPRLVVVTAHRRENFGAPLLEICQALGDLATRYGPALQLVYPVHLNPNVWDPVHRVLAGLPNVHLVPPLDYLPLVHLLKHAHLVLTDSGGIQEEAPGLGVPVLVLREVTERPEAVTAGTVRIVGASRPRIVAEASRLLDDATAHAAMAHTVNPYGDGRAAERIVGTLLGEPVAPWCPETAPAPRLLEARTG